MGEDGVASPTPCLRTFLPVKRHCDDVRDGIGRPGEEEGVPGTCKGMLGEVRRISAADTPGERGDASAGWAGVAWSCYGRLTYRKLKGVICDQLRRRRRTLYSLIDEEKRTKRRGGPMAYGRKGLYGAVSKDPIKIGFNGHFAWSTGGCAADRFWKKRP